MTLFNRGEKPTDAAGQSKPQAGQPQAAKSESAKSAELFSASNPIQTSTTTPTGTGASMASVISKALKITGQLESTEDIQIDGQIDGDVRGVGVKIGQSAKVKGTVYGDEVEVAGTIDGKIESKKVILAGTARMTGDILHQEIKIESGAYINGSLKPELGKSDSKSPYKPASVASGSPLSASNTPLAAHHRSTSGNGGPLAS